MTDLLTAAKEMLDVLVADEWFGPEHHARWQAAIDAAGCQPIETAPKDGTRVLLARLGKTAADDGLLDLLTILDSNGLDDALWVLSNTPRLRTESRRFGAWCARQVLHLYEARYPGDLRPRHAIEAAENPDTTEKELDAARDAAWDAAWGAAGDAAWDAWDAARAAAWDAAWDAWDAARNAAWAAQERALRQFCTEGTLP
jgi:hypothetical protein